MYYPMDKAKQLFINEISVFSYIWVIYLALPFIQGDYENHGGPSLDVAFLIFSGSHILLTVIHNFWLIPHFFYKNRYPAYLLLVLGSLIAFGALEEGIWEQIFYPETRGTSFGLRDIFYSWFELGTILFLFGAYKLVWDHQKKQKKINELEKEKAESELKFLKSQINPHVFFNNLNSIYSFALEHSEKLSDMVLKLSDIMRYMLYECNDRYVPLEKELSYLNNFIELQKMRLEDRGKVSFHIEGSPKSYYIAPLLLITFVENSFKHSMETISETIKVDISTKIKEEVLIFRVTNNYVDNNSDGSNHGIGLKNVKKRLALLYPGQHSLVINKSESSYSVTLELTLCAYEDTLHYH